MWSVFVCGWLALAGTASAVVAQEPAANPYKAADGLAPEALQAFLEKMKDRPKTLQNRPAFQAALVDAADRILAAGAQAKADLQAQAVMTKFRALYQMVFLGDMTALQTLNELAETYKADARSEIANEASLVLMEKRFREFDPSAKEKLVPMLSELKELLKKQAALGERHLELASSATGLINKIPDDLSAIEQYLEFGKLFSASSNAEMTKYGRQLLKFGQKMELMTKPIELSGTLLDATELKWSDYKGKIVLIDFWATWCGPCIEEIPNLKKNYEQYHAQGFEILGISIDDEPETVRKFVEEKAIPWPILFSHDPDAKGGNHPLAKKFNVRAIPTMIVVGRDGRIAALNARGPALGELLAKLITEKKGEGRPLGGPIP